MVTISMSSSSSSGHLEPVVKFEGAMLGPGRSKPRQVSSVSAMTADTCATETSSLTDEEEEVPDCSGDTTKAKEDVHHLLDELLMVVISTRKSGLAIDYSEASPEATSITSSSSNSRNNSTPDRSSHSIPDECKTEEDQDFDLKDLSAEQKVALLLRKAKNRSNNPRSILRRCGMDIPVSNKGWKNLPKLTELPQNVATPAIARNTAGTLSRQVRFQAVVVRCYDQCIGDNPAVSYGTPISLDWDYEQMAPIDLNAYESSRTMRRSARQMMMNYYNRRNVLIYRFGFSEEDVIAGEKAANKIRSQRSLTRALLPTSMLEDMVSSVGRKAKRKFGGGKKQ